MSINVLYFSPVKIHQMFLPVSPIFSDIRFLTSPKFPCRDWTSSSPAAPFHRWPAPPAPQATAPGRRARRWWPWRRSEGHSHGGKTTTRKRWGLPGLVYPKFSEFQIDRRDLIHHDWLMYHKTLQGVDFSFVSVQMRQLSWHHGVGWRERLHSNLAFFTKRIGLSDVPKPKLTARCGKSTISRWFSWNPWLSISLLSPKVTGQLNQPFLLGHVENPWLCRSALSWNIYRKPWIFLPSNITGWWL